MPIYFAGLTSSVLFTYRRDYGLQSIEPFSQILYPQLTDIEIGSTYLLLWQSGKLLVTFDPDERNGLIYKHIQLNPAFNEHCRLVVPHHLKEKISILSTNNVIREYDINRNVWRLMNIFIPHSLEYAVKIIHCGCNMLLTNLGRLLTMHNHQEIKIPNVKFINIAHGAKHVVLLGNDYNVYEIIIRLRQLQNGNMELDYIVGPNLVQELFGRKIVRIAAGTWHSAAITEQGHLYTWGSNAFGELGIGCFGNVQLIPRLVSFEYNIGIKVTKVECGNCFTICLINDHTLWGVGCNSCYQFGQPYGDNLRHARFIKLDMQWLSGKMIKDFKCNESGTAIITE